MIKTDKLNGFDGKLHVDTRVTVTYDVRRHSRDRRVDAAFYAEVISSLKKVGYNIDKFTIEEIPGGLRFTNSNTNYNSEVIGV